jgi:hypothetical protein
VLVPALIDNSVRLWPFQGKLESLFLPGRTVIEETLPGRVLRRVLRRPLRAKTYIESRREFGSNFLRPEQGTGLPLITTAEFTATEQWLNRGNIASSCTPIVSMASNSTQRCWRRGQEPLTIFGRCVHAFLNTSGTQNALTVLEKYLARVNLVPAVWASVREVVFLHRVWSFSPQRIALPISIRIRWHQIHNAQRAVVGRFESTLPQ